MFNPAMAWIQSPRTSSRRARAVAIMHGRSVCLYSAMRGTHLSAREKTYPAEQTTPERHPRSHSGPRSHPNPTAIVRPSIHSSSVHPAAIASVTHRDRADVRTHRRAVHGSVTTFGLRLTDLGPPAQVGLVFFLFLVVGTCVSARLVCLTRAEFDGLGSSETPARPGNAARSGEKGRRTCSACLRLCSTRCSCVVPVNLSFILRPRVRLSSCCVEVEAEAEVEACDDEGVLCSRLWWWDSLLSLALSEGGAAGASFSATSG